MSLAKRRELEDLKITNSKAETLISNTYSRIRNEAVKSAIQDFNDFFTTNSFVVKNLPPVFPSKISDGINATYGRMYATLEKVKDEEYNLSLRSNIKDEEILYSIGVYADNPRYQAPKYGSYSVRVVPQKTELEQIEDDIINARKKSETLQETIEGLPETKALIVYRGGR